VDVGWNQYRRVLVLIGAAKIGESTLRARYKVSYRKLARLFREYDARVSLVC
jgi:hypothetical protein